MTNIFTYASKEEPQYPIKSVTTDRFAMRKDPALKGLPLSDLRMPDFRTYAVDVPSPGSVQAADTHVTGEFLRDVAKLNQEQRDLRIFGPGETLSNRLTYRRTNHENMHVRGYKEKGAITTTFDMPEIRNWKWGNPR